MFQHKPRTLYTHWFGHALNLAAQDAGVKIMADNLETVHEILSSLKISSIFKAIKKQQAQLEFAFLVQL